jgi:hypothetical protein
MIEMILGDVLVFINEECVLGATQEDAIRIFQSIPVGDQVFITVCRGYPLLFDPNDEIVCLFTFTAHKH